MEGNKNMNKSSIVLCGIADEELSSQIKDYGFELYRYYTDVPVNRMEDIRVVLGGGYKNEI